MWIENRRHASDLIPQTAKFFHSYLEVFNLFPLPPLDGGRVLVGLLPYRQAELVSRIEPWGFFVVMALVIAGVLTDWWMRPLMTLSYDLLEIVLTPLAMLVR